MADIKGTSDKDFLQGTVDSDTISAGDGNDVVFAGGGDDNVLGEGGDDYILGEAGSDTLNGGTGLDEVFGGDGNDIIYGEDGSDKLYGDKGDDEIEGGDGADLIEGGRVSDFDDDGNDILRGGAGNDIIHGGGGNDNILGGGENDQISGGKGQDYIDGGDGDDFLDGNGALDADTVLGGAGDDSINASYGDIVDGGPGIDTVYLDFFASGNNGVEADLRQLANGGALAIGGATISGIEYVGRVSLTQFDDKVIAGPIPAGITGVEVSGWAGNDDLTGTAGVDNIFGGDGDDVIRGGGGSNPAISPSGDRLRGEAGHDTIYIGQDGAEALGGTGDDVIYGGPGADEIRGDDGVDLLFGDAGDDGIDGGSGDDTLEGGSGNDTLDGFHGSDTASYASAASGVTVVLTSSEFGSAQNTGGAGVDTLHRIENLAGSAFADTLRGSSGPNQIAGGPGDDLLLLQDGGEDTANGGAGDDGFYLGAALSSGDVLDGGDGELDQLGLQGNYGSFGEQTTFFTFGASHLTNIEQVVLLPGSDTRFGDNAGADYTYALRTIDANVEKGERLIVTANTLSKDENVIFDGSAETDGYFLTFGGQGADILTGGQQDDGFFFGIDKRFDAIDRVDGRGGVDQLGLQGVYTGESRIVFGDNQLTSIEFIVALTGGDTRFGANGAGYSYDITTSDGNVLAGATMIVSANTLQADEVFVFDGSAESDGRFRIFSGDGADSITAGDGSDEITGRGGDDTINGGDGTDTITGGLGADALTGGLDADTFIYAGPAESTGLEFDTLLGFDYREDRIDLPGEVAGFSDLVEGGTLRQDSFNADLAAAVNEGLLPNAAVIFRPDAGDYAGRDFAIVDANGDGVYTAGEDFVFEVVDPAIPIDPVSDFFI